MNITGFCPLIVTRDPESAMKAFEGLGFERRHTKTGIEGGSNTNYAMKDAFGNRINIASSERIPKDLSGITINVDNYEEAYEYFTSIGFVNPRGEGRTTETPSAKATMLFAPSGFAVNISEHIRRMRAGESTLQELSDSLREDPQRARQLIVMLDVAEEAFKNNMSSYGKLVQMAAIRKFDEHCDRDGVKGERVNFLYSTMDPIMRQINNELEGHIAGKFKELKALTGVSDNECAADAECADTAAVHEQQEVINALKEDPGKAKQVDVMLGIIYDAFKSSMTAYIKLVHSDVMTDFDARCDKDGVGGERVLFSHGMLDPMMKQINKDLQDQIKGLFAGVRESMDTGK